MHIHMQISKNSKVIVERADFSFIMLRFLNTGRRFFLLFFISIVIYSFVR